MSAFTATGDPPLDRIWTVYGRDSGTGYTGPIVQHNGPIPTAAASTYTSGTIWVSPSTTVPVGTTLPYTPGQGMLPSLDEWSKMYPPVNEQPVWGGYIPDPFSTSQPIVPWIKTADNTLPNSEKDIEEVLKYIKAVAPDLLTPKKAAPPKEEAPKKEEAPAELQGFKRKIDLGD